jgi:GTP-binding protein EngB required for normal cell division
VGRSTLALPDRLAALDRALELAEGRVDPDRLASARAIRGKADERLARGDGLVVAALMGGTGSGKSSLFNALAGSDLSPVGVRRPTTEVPRAALSSAAAADGGGRLLDWLEVPQRHEDPPGPEGDTEVSGRRAGRRRAPAGWPEGLVLLDVPDHDSVAPGHRETVDRLVDRVDVLVWVVDPLKYAMRSLHQGYLARLATHADVLLVVLNRADELSETDLEACRTDLRRLLDGEQLRDARLLVTSARTGQGVGELSAVLRREVDERTAGARRLAGDLRTAAADLGIDVGTQPPGPLDDDGVVEALAGAAGVGGVAATAGAESRQEAMAGTRPVLSRAGAAVASRGPALLRHLRGYLPGRGEGRARPSAHAAPVGVRHAVVEVVDRCAGPLPTRWRGRLHEVAGVDSGALARAVAGAIDRVPLRSPRRWWWPLVAALLSLLELATLAGIVWLGVLGVLGWLQLPVPDPPVAVGEVPWPTALLVGGGLLRLLGGVIRRRLTALGAARYRRTVALQLLEAVREVADTQVIRPLRAELDAREELRELLAELAA